MSGKKITIAELAEKLGKPKAKVYSLLEKPQYKGFVSVVDGLKMVDVALLDVLNGEKPKAKEEAPAAAESRPGSSLEPDTPQDPVEAATMQGYIQQIEELKATIAARDAEILRLSLELAEMAKTSQSITEKALNAVNQQQILTALAHKKTPWYKRLLGGGRADA